MADPSDRPPGDEGHPNGSRGGPRVAVAYAELGGVDGGGRWGGVEEEDDVVAVVPRPPPLGAAPAWEDRDRGLYTDDDLPGPSGQHDADHDPLDNLPSPGIDRDRASQLELERVGLVDPGEPGLAFEPCHADMADRHCHCHFHCQSRWHCRC